MQLSSEDLLRINVLLAHNCEAIRIDEQAMIVYGLAGDNEAAIALNPNCRAEQYLRRVRELLSNHALGSPGGYPVFLQRWTRMGQQRGTQLDRLLLLGEPEAVVAVAGAPDLTDELARRAWWCQPTMENARRMLERKSVVQGAMGRILADFLVEHLAFETDHLAVVMTIKLILQPGLIETAVRERIWARGTHRNAYRLGFVEAIPDSLPQPRSSRTDLERYADRLARLAAGGSAPASLLHRLLDHRGQTYLAAIEELLTHPLDKFTSAHLLSVIGDYFGAARIGETETDIADVTARARSDYATAAGAIAALRETLPEIEEEIVAMLALGHTGEPLATPIIAKTTASGTLLRRKLEPVLHPLLGHIQTLRRSRS
jgi:hypothetical protein